MMKQSKNTGSGTTSSVKSESGRDEGERRDNPIITMMTIFTYMLLIFVGKVRDNFGRMTGISRYYHDITGKTIGEGKRKAYPPLLYPENTFFTRRIFNRIRDCWDRPIDSPPGAHINVLHRTLATNKRSLVVPDEAASKDINREAAASRCLNLGSYNYLGFADNWQETCGESVYKALREVGPSSFSPPTEGGYHSVVRELEQYVAKFLNKPDAVVFSMGYGTNTAAISLLLAQGDLLISDSLNHTSIVNGCRGTRGARIAPFKHNDMSSLEHALKVATVYGTKANFAGSNKSNEGKSFVPFGKIMVLVEGIYSMEGETTKLREVVELCKKYKAYLYVDEAHSIGALGKTGRGVCEYRGVDTSEVDILMGTFSKSFGGMGGYITSSSDIVNTIRANSFGTTSMSALSPTVAVQILTAFKYITGEKLFKGINLGEQKLKAISENAAYFRQGLRKMGCQVLGDDHSPVIPLMVFMPTKTAAFSRQCLKRGIAVVVVGYPAVPLYEARVRFCISAGHTKEDLKQALKDIEKVCRILNVRYTRQLLG